MRILNYFFGLICIVAGIFMFASFPILLESKATNSEIVNSVLDKLLFFFMLGGCGIVYLLFGIALFKTMDFLRQKTISLLMIIGISFFMAGIYYHIIFQSPW